MEGQYNPTNLYSNMSTFVLEAISEGYSQGGSASKRIYGRGERTIIKRLP
jgi:hypothetical protein